MYLHYAVFLPVHWHPQRRNRQMRRLAFAIALACVLSGGVRAGEIHPTGVVAPPPSGTVTAASEIPTTGATAPEASNSVLTIVLTLLSIVR